MTEEEKRRLEDLLKDVDNIPELPEGEENVVRCLILERKRANSEVILTVY